MGLEVEIEGNKAVTSMPEWLFWLICVPWMAVGAEYIITDSVRLWDWLFA